MDRVIYQQLEDSKVSLPYIVIRGSFASTQPCFIIRSAVGTAGRHHLSPIALYSLLQRTFLRYIRYTAEIVLLRLGGMATVVGIAGLTGKFAQCVAKELQAYPGVTIKGFCRSPQKLSQKALLKYKIKVIQGEFDDEAAVQRFVRGTDIVICCYFGDPDVMTRGQKILVEACAREGVPRYLPSDFAVDYTKIPARELFPKESAKIIKDYLVEKKVAGVHVLVGGLIETFWSGFFQIYDAQTQTMAYWGTGDEKWDLTTYETAAAYTAALVTDKNAAGVFRCNLSSSSNARQ